MRLDHRLGLPVATVAVQVVTGHRRALGQHERSARQLKAWRHWQRLMAAPAALIGPFLVVERRGAAARAGRDAVMQAE